MIWPLLPLPHACFGILVENSTPTYIGWCCSLLFHLICYKMKAMSTVALDNFIAHFDSESTFPTTEEVVVDDLGNYFPEDG